MKKGRRRSRTSEEEFEASVTLDDSDEGNEEEDDSDDEDARPESLDDKVRKKEMRKGIDLATTLERIEKNFVITDPRLPDNPIVRTSKFYLFIFFLTVFYKYIIN